MGLTRYQAKRRFERTPEPSGDGGAEASVSNGGLVYVIQKHRAKRLHWDLRLQEGNLLKSWAVPKEPPADAGVRRLAVEVEDHPLDYASFEGTIPAGEYGAGEVEIWDSGTYRVIETTPVKRWIEIFGTRLRGAYVLLKLKPGEKDDRNWLFFKTKPFEMQG
jgi:DNA ligase D-like protein (predicted 3'-phosphoesterase)